MRVDRERSDRTVLPLFQPLAGIEKHPAPSILFVSDYVGHFFAPLQCSRYFLQAGYFIFPRLSAPQPQFRLICETIRHAPALSLFRGELLSPPLDQIKTSFFPVKPV